MRPKILLLVLILIAILLVVVSVSIFSTSQMKYEMGGGSYGFPTADYQFKDNASAERFMDELSSVKWKNEAVAKMNAGVKPFEWMIEDVWISIQKRTLEEKNTVVVIVNGGLKRAVSEIHGSSFFGSPTHNLDNVYNQKAIGLLSEEVEVAYRKFCDK